MATNSKEVKKEELVTGMGSFDLDSFSGVVTSGTTGLEAVDQTDLKLPKVKIVQMTSEEFTKDGIAPGSFYNTVTKESSETLDCVLLALGKSRVMWPAQFKRGDKPLCRSFDGINKTEGCGEAKCAKCDYAVWPEDGGTPPCTQGYVWLAVDAEGRPFRISAQGSSVSPTKDFINAVAPKLRRGNTSLGIFVFKIRLSTEKLSNDKGTYFIIKYSLIGTIEPSKYSEFEGLSASLRELFLQAIDKDTKSDDHGDYGDSSAAESEVPESVNGGNATSTQNGKLF